MAEEKGHQVTELKYRGQKSKASKYMNIVEAFVNQLGEDRSEVESYAERQRIMDPLAQAETAIHTLEEYLAEHEAWEFHEKEKAEDFIDEDLQTAAKADVDYMAIRDAIQQGVHVNDLGPDHPAKLYKLDWHLLGVYDFLIVLGDRILVPRALRKPILRNLHLGHFGQQKTVALANNMFFWKGMKNEIVQLVECCDKCQTFQRKQQKEPMRPTFASRPMEQNSFDLAEYNKKSYLIQTDRYTGFLWVHPLRKTGATDVINKLFDVFYQFGFPKKVRSDNGPQMIAKSTLDKFKEFNIEQEFSDPHFARSNGAAEQAVQVAKMMIKKASSEEEIKQAVQQYNSAPNSSGLSPHAMMFGRAVQTTLPMLENAFKQVPQKTIEAAQQRKNERLLTCKKNFDKTAKELPELEVGRKVRILNQRTNKWDLKGVITFKDEKTKRSYRIQTNDGTLLFRNRTFIRPVKFYKNERRKSLDLHTKPFAAGMLRTPMSSSISPTLAPISV